MLKTWCIIFIRPFFKLGIFNTRLDHIKTKPLILLDKIELISFRLTDSTKINRQGHSIRMYWTKVSQPTVHVRQNNFETALIEACSPDLYASFGTFCVQIGQLFEAQWVFEVCLKVDESMLCYRRKMSSISVFFRIFKDSLCRE